jgi:hypothetical protein
MLLIEPKYFIIVASILRIYIFNEFSTSVMEEDDRQSLKM